MWLESINYYTHQLVSDYRNHFVLKCIYFAALEYVPGHKPRVVTIPHNAHLHIWIKGTRNFTNTHKQILVLDIFKCISYSDVIQWNYWKLATILYLVWYVFGISIALEPRMSYLIDVLCSFVLYKCGIYMYLSCLKGPVAFKVQ